jgi:hypothetical protein
VASELLDIKEEAQELLGALRSKLCLRNAFVRSLMLVRSPAMHPHSLAQEEEGKSSQRERVEQEKDVLGGVNLKCEQDATYVSMSSCKRGYARADRQRITVGFAQDQR